MTDKPVTAVSERERARAWRNSKEIFAQRWKNANPDSGMSSEDREVWMLAAYRREGVREALMEAADHMADCRLDFAAQWLRTRAAELERADQ